MTKSKMLAAMSALALLGACAGGSDDAGSGAEVAADGANFVVVHSIKDLMENVVEVQAQVFWGSAGYIIDEQGETDLTPTTDEGWLATRSAAATVAEMGNLLMTPQYADGRGGDWMEFSRALAEMGKRSEQAAIDRDSDAIFETGGDLYSVCKSCHMTYVDQGIALEGESEDAAE